MSTDQSNIAELKQLLNKASEAKRLWKFSAKAEVRGLYAADVDADGQIEVIVGTNENLVYLLDARDGELRWCFDEAKGWVPTVYVASIRGEAEAEIIAGSDDGYVYVLGAGGEKLWQFGATLRMRSVYAADVDQNGKIEVLSASFDKHLYIFDGDGRLKKNYNIGELTFRLRAADIDDDGQVEIVAATDSGKVLICGESDTPQVVSCLGRVFALELADIDGDGCTEIIAGSFDNNLYAWNGQTLELKWQVDLEERVYATLVTDVDHDGANEILAATRDRFLNVLNVQGQLKWKIALDHWAFDIWVGDIDGDGHLELLTCSELEDCVQLYRLPDIKGLQTQIQHVYGQIEEAPSLDWEMSREQWELLGLAIPGIDLPKRATRPGVCDRQLQLSQAQALYEDAQCKEAIELGLELRGHRLDFVWDYDLKAEVRGLGIYHDAPPPHAPLILCAPDHRSFLAIDSSRNKVIDEDVPFPARRIFVTDLIPDRKTIVVGLNSGVYTYDYPQNFGTSFPSRDWIEDMAIGYLEGDERPNVFIASFDGRVYAWNSRMALKWFYPRQNKTEPVYAVYALDLAWQTKASVVIGSFDGTVEALDASGECLWEYRCGERAFVVRAADFSGEEEEASQCLILVGSDDRKVHALDTDGALRWQYYTGHPVKWIEVFDIDEDGRLEILVSASNGSFYILDEEGDSRLECNLGSWVQGLQIADIDSDGRLEMCFGLRNRKKLFTYHFLPEKDIQAFLDKCLRAWQDQAGTEAVVQTLQTDPDNLLRAYGVRIRLGSPQFDKDQVQSILQDRAENVRLELALALPRLAKEEPDEAMKWLERLADDSSWRVRRQVVANLAGFYEANHKMAERCVDLLQNDDHPRVQRRLVRSLVKMPQAGDWSYQKLLAMIQREETDEWVRHEIIRGLASFLDEHPRQAPGLLDFKPEIPKVLELLNKESVAFHMLTLSTDTPPDSFEAGVLKLAQYMAQRLNQDGDGTEAQIPLPESVRAEGEVYAVTFQNIESILEELDIPKPAATLPFLFQHRKTPSTRDICSLLERGSIGVFVSFEDAISRQTQELLKSLSLNYKLAPLTYAEFLDLITKPHPWDALRDVLRQSIRPETGDWAVPFIGREEELEAIRTHLVAWNSRRIVFVQGEGGIGKTRLLDEVDRHFAAVEINFPLRVLSIVDFDDDQYKVPQNVLVGIARQLDPGVFYPYFSALHQMHLVEEGLTEKGEPAASVRRKAFAVERHFIECFNAMSRDQRIILRLDTTDALDDDMPIASLLKIFSMLDNVLVLIAGRNTDDLYQEYGKVTEETLLLPLQPFGAPDNRAYLAKKQNILKVTLEQEWMAKLFILAGGLPVLIDLAIEWAQSHRPLPWMDELSLSDLEALQQQAQSGDDKARRELGGMRERFKQIAVMPIADLRDSLDHLKLVLSKVYPLDLEGMMEMLNLSQEEAERLIDEALQSVSVKRLPDERIKLHDEVQRLLNEYVWPQFDQDGGREQRDSRRAIAYLTRKSDALLDEIRQLRQREFELIETQDPAQTLAVFGERREKEAAFEALRIERLRRQLAIDVQAGYELFQDDYRLDIASSPYRQGLLAEISPYADWDNPKRDVQSNTLQKHQRREVQMILARHATFAGLYDKAAELYQRLLDEIPPNNEEYIEVLIGRANQLVRAGDLREALKDNKRALAIAQQLDSPKWVMRATLEIGWVHRLIGDLEETIKNYNNALMIAIEYDDEEQIALLYNNLAYAHALQGQDMEALNEVRQAIRLWRELARKREENRFRLGQCYNIAGEVHLELNRSEEALPYFELSWDIFNREEVQKGVRTAEWKSKARSGRGFAYWQLAVANLRKGDTEAAHRNLQNALDDLVWAEEHATETDSPSILNRRGEAHFLLKDYQATERDWQESMAEAQQVGDVLTEFRSLSNLARLAFYHEIEKFPNWHTFKKWYDENYQRRFQARSELLIGLFHTCLGHLALKGGEIEEAISLYEQGLPILAQKRTYAPFNLTDQLDFIESEILPSISPASTQQVGEALKKKWIAGAHDVSALTYFREWSRWPGPKGKTLESEYA